jgi:hypothetical protein
VNAHGLTIAGEIHRIDSDSAAAGKCVGLALNIYEIGTRIILPGSQQFLRIGIGQRIQQHAVYHAKDCRVGADTQGQGQHRASRKRGRVS